MFAGVGEALNNACAGKEVVIETTVHRLVTELRDTGSVCDVCSSSDKTAEIMAVPVASSAAAATAGHGCKNSVLTLIPSSCA
jgi:hypothetical protein